MSTHSVEGEVWQMWHFELLFQKTCHKKSFLFVGMLVLTVSLTISTTIVNTIIQGRERERLTRAPRRPKEWLSCRLALISYFAWNLFGWPHFDMALEGGDDAGGGGSRLIISSFDRVLSTVGWCDGGLSCYPTSLISSFAKILSDDLTCREGGCAPVFCTDGGRCVSSCLMCVDPLLYSTSDLTTNWVIDSTQHSFGPLRPPFIHTQKHPLWLTSSKASKLNWICLQYFLNKHQSNISHKFINIINYKWHIKVKSLKYDLASPVNLVNRYLLEFSFNFYRVWAVRRCRCLSRTICPSLTPSSQISTMPSSNFWKISQWHF